MSPYRFLRQLPDPDAGELQEWVDRLDGLTEARGKARASKAAVMVARASRRLHGIRGHLATYGPAATR
jgi:hypothetical protein